MTGTARAFVLAAHPGEARPLAKALGLRASHDSPLPTYSNDDTVVAVSGQGAQNMAAACGFLQGTYAPRWSVWLNAGLCGHSGAVPLGTPLLANKVLDWVTGDTWFPHVSFDSPLGRTSLTTVAAPDFTYERETVDMEGAGFARAALRFTTAENVHLVKVVSDTPRAPDPTSPQRGEQLMTDAAPAILRVLDALRNQLREQVALHAYQPWFLESVSQWHFTATERAQLESILRRWQSLLPGPSPLETLPDNARVNGKAVLEYLRIRVDQASRSHSLRQ